jgi:23S rRNA (adenine2030-N6)-methyltransferase
MLSYRHSFHAGNFADVLKHLVLIKILEHLGKKDKPFSCIDTHSGPGHYLLNGEYALKNKEFENGIAQLWHRNDLPEDLNTYVKLIKRFNNTDSLLSYPGSPLITQQYLRSNDHLSLYELHSTEIELLKSAIKRDRRIHAFHADGLINAINLLPPKEHRGLVFIDPSYEIKSDYDLVTKSLIHMHKRFARGIYALWYPVIERKRNLHLENVLKTSGLRNIQLFELGIKEDSLEHGMTSSGMIVINPPWTLAEDMQKTLPWLSKILGIDGAGSFRIETLVTE